MTKHIGCSVLSWPWIVILISTVWSSWVWSESWSIAVRMIREKIHSWFLYIIFSDVIFSRSRSQITISALRPIPLVSWRSYFDSLSAKSGFWINIGWTRWRVSLDIKKFIFSVRSKPISLILSSISCERVFKIDKAWRLFLFYSLRCLLRSVNAYQGLLPKL